MEYFAGSLSSPIYLSRSLHKNQNCITFRSIHFVSTTWFHEFLILKCGFSDWSKDCFDRFRNWNFGIRKTMRWSAYFWLSNWIWCSSKLFWKRKFEANGRFVARCKYEQQVWTYSNIGQHEMLQILHLQQLSTSVRLKAEVSVNEWASETFLFRGLLNCFVLEDIVL